MAVNIGSKIVLSLSVPSIDWKYGPYASVQNAWDTLGPDGEDVACIGLTVGIQPTVSSPIVEYWFREAASAYTDLVVKIPDIDVDNYYTKSETYSKSEVYTKTESDNTFATQQALSGKQDSLTAATADRDKYLHSNSSTGAPEWVDLNQTLDLKEDASNKTQVLSSQSTQVQYPTAKCVYDALVAKQNDLNILSGSGAPTTSTVGIVNQLYISTSSPAIYVCTAASAPNYTWSQVTLCTMELSGNDTLNITLL